MFNIGTMILLLFILFGILIITFVVLIADEEIEILHEMPDVDSSIFRHELSELWTFFPFCFMVFVLVFNITLITRDDADEIWFYIKDDATGIKFLNSILFIYIVLLALLCIKL